MRNDEDCYNLALLFCNLVNSSMENLEMMAMMAQIGLLDLLKDVRKRRRRPRPLQQSELAHLYDPQIMTDADAEYFNPAKDEEAQTYKLNHAIVHLELKAAKAKKLGSCKLCQKIPGKNDQPFLICATCGRKYCSVMCQQFDMKHHAHTCIAPPQI
eukprot:GFYU01031150.1.p1 GENE.GFYU01031150.1~~GFYU01031150.1.p1  ORF type:complete len:172 (+),score=14.08 GFYU01031150.1:49-516(+)